jgi:hypothetical protein
MRAMRKVSIVDLHLHKGRLLRRRRKLPICTVAFSEEFSVAFD